jgi:hypothetical protein
VIKTSFMNKFISCTSIVLLVLTCTVSCKKNNLVVDQDVVPPAYAKFNVRIAEDTAATYYITGAGTPFKIPIGITTVSNKDRTIQFCYTSATAAAGVQYNAPASIVIPADILYIKICGGDVPVSDYLSTFKLTIRKYCDVVLANLGGNFDATEYLEDGSYYYGPYGSGVVNLTTTGATTASGKLVNLFDYGWNDINFTMDWSDPANFKITIPLQATGVSNAGGNYSYVRSTEGKINTFSSCEETFSISVDLMLSPTDVDYSGYQIKLRR